MAISIPKADKATRIALQKLSKKIAAESSPTFTGLTLTGLTASRLISTDSSKALASVTDLTAWIAGTTNQITSTSDGDGTVTLSTPQDIHTAATPTFGGLTLTGLTGILWSNSGVVTGDAALNQLANPTGDKTFNMTTRQLSFLWTNPSGNPIEFEASGAYTGSLVHIHQHTGNPGSTYLLTLEATDTDVEHIGTTGAAATTHSLCTYVSGDTEERFLLQSDGTMLWGAGGVTAADTNLYRSAANTLKTDDDFIANDITITTPSNIYALSHDSFADFSADEHFTQASITTVGTIGTGVWQGTAVGIGYGGTGQTTQQAAIDTLTNVSAATNEHVLTKDTATGNAIFKAAPSGDNYTVKVDAAATADYIGAASNDGVLRVTTTNGLTYADGGNYITIGFDADYTDISGNDATTDVTGAELETLTDGSITTLHGHFVDRGDPAAWDFAVGDLTTDGTWRDLDLSSIVPAGAKAVAIIVGIQDDAVGNTLQLRKNGNSNAVNKSATYTFIANTTITMDCIVACDSNRVIEYYASNTTWTAINIAVKGWWIGA